MFRVVVISDAVSNRYRHIFVRGNREIVLTSMLRNRGKNTMDNDRKKNSWRRKETEKRKKSLSWNFFLPSTSFPFISFAFRTSISARSQRTAGSRHFPTKSSREDFLLIDVETPERWERAEEHKGRKDGKWQEDEGIRARRRKRERWE